MSRTLALRPADPDELDYVERLLADSDLPEEDVRANADCFYIAVDGDRRVGIGGIEPYGTDALLRSVIVETPRRGEGLGTALCDALESRAAADGIERLYLLTTTAADFFADRGYERIDRSDAPEPIRSTREFADLCPSTATCMRTSIGPTTDRPEP